MKKFIPMLLLLAGCAKSEFQHTEVVDAPFAVLWEVWTDVENWPEWDTEMSTASLDGPFREGARGEAMTPDGTIPLEISRVDEGRGYTLTFELVLAKMHIDRDAIAVGAGQSFTHRFRFEGANAGIYAAARSAYFEGILPDVMRQLKAIVENRAQQGSGP